MIRNDDLSAASAEAVIAMLGRRLEDIRLSRNVSQADLARQAGVSRSTLTRLADGKAVSLDSFVRVMQALKLESHLAGLLPNPGVRPVERARLDGSERQRARRRRAVPAEWKWGEEEDRR